MDKRTVLQKHSPKPKGRCYCERKADIKYDLQVIIPVYNQERYIGKCLESLKTLFQRNSKVIVQIVDDGSTDNSGKIIDNYKAALSADIDVIHQPNQGVSAARNRGLDTLCGEYIMLLDADDYLPDDIDIDALLQEAKGNDILQGNWVTVDTQNNVIEKFTTDHVTGYACMKLYHYSIFEHLMFPEGYWYEDTPITAILCGLDLKKATTDKCIYCYRINPDGASYTFDNPKTIDTYWITEVCLDEFSKFGVKYDGSALYNFLYQVKNNGHRVRRQPLAIRKAVFELTAELLGKYFPNIHSDDFKQLERILRRKQFLRFELKIRRD